MVRAQHIPAKARRASIKILIGAILLAGAFVGVAAKDGGVLLGTRGGMVTLSKDNGVEMAQANITIAAITFPPIKDTSAAIEASAVVIKQPETPVEAKVEGGGTSKAVQVAPQTKTRMQEAMCAELAARIEGDAHAKDIKKLIKDEKAREMIDQIAERMRERLKHAKLAPSPQTGRRTMCTPSRHVEYRDIRRFVLCGCEPTRDAETGKQT